MWTRVSIFLALLTFTAAATIDKNVFVDLPLKSIKTSAQRISEHGYPAESHYVTTSDGYILNIFRIPYSPKLNNEKEKKPVVFIQHGLFSCSDCFLLNGPDNAIAYNFADAGYDVWLGNARGNIYSCNHTTMSTQHPYFWRFDWHEIGTIDMPASIDYVLAKTGESTLHYVGHSQGTTVFFVMASERPEYNAKIRTSHMLAPAVFMGNTSDGLVVLLSPYVGEPGTPSTILADQPFLPYNPLVQRMLDTACGGNPRFPQYCHTLFLLWSGPDQPNLNATLLPQLAETHPAGISTNQGIHYIQNFRSNGFNHFDHGKRQNMKLYGQEKPTPYPLENISTEMYIYYGLADGTANPEDAQRLPEHLPNLKEFIEVPNKDFNHVDFIFALKVKELINDPVINFCKAYDEKLEN